MRSIKFIVLLLVIIFSLGWPYYAGDFAIDKTNRYRPLANGWVSLYADIHLQEDTSFVDKIKQTISEDLVHGRFRPAFFFYVTSSYAISPFIHGRSTLEEGRPYRKLMTGDLRLFSIILLATLGLSFVVMSLLIYRYTNESIFSFLPILFVPLSPALTENLLQNYIDSQEILLVLLLSVWMFFLFLAVNIPKKGIRFGYLMASLPFLLLAFLTKETVLILSVALPLITILMKFIGVKEEPGIMPMLVTTSIAIICSVGVYLVVSTGKTGYATNYGALNKTAILEAATHLWNGFSKFSLNSIYGYIPIILFFLIAWRERKKAVHNIPVINHAALLVLLLLISAGFFLIIVPWRPILIKYLFPSIFFFSFAVAFSLSFLAVWCKERFGNKGWLCYLLILPYLFNYNTFYASANQERDYWADTAGYGVTIIDELAESIERKVKSTGKEQQAVFVEYGVPTRWAHNIPWAKLHLMRVLNLEKEINFVQQNGEHILNYKMPKAELTSLREYKDGKRLYLSNNLKELAAFQFDAVYRGCGIRERPNQKITEGNGKFCYRMTGERINWQGRSQSFPGFSLYQYKPVDCSME